MNQSCTTFYSWRKTCVSSDLLPHGHSCQRKQPWRQAYMDISIWKYDSLIMLRTYEWMEILMHLELDLLIELRIRRSLISNYICTISSKLWYNRDTIYDLSYWHCFTALLFCQQLLWCIQWVFCHFLNVNRKKTRKA